jgi:hypothetical protein
MRNIGNVLDRADAFVRGEPLTSGKDTPTAATFPLRVFPPWLRRYASEVAASCEIPVSVVGFGIMGMLSACFGMHILVAVKNRYVTYCHDWFFLVAKVSLGKSLS